MTTELIVGLCTFLATSIGALLIVYIRKIEKVDSINVIEEKLANLVDQVSSLVDRVGLIIETEHMLDKRVSLLEDNQERVRKKIHDHSNALQKLEMRK